MLQITSKDKYNQIIQHTDKETKHTKKTKQKTKKQTNQKNKTNKKNKPTKKTNQTKTIISKLVSTPYTSSIDFAEPCF